MSFLNPLLAKSAVHVEVHKAFDVYYTDEMDADNGTILTFFGGANVDVKRYEDLSYALLNKFPSGVVVVAKFFADMPNPLQAKSRMTILLEALQELGWQKPHTKAYVLGHSQGGMMAYNLVEAFDLQGLILLGSYLPRTLGLASPFRLDEFPKPILTLGGELDGLTGIHYMAREFEDAKRYQQGAAPDDYSHEVWVLPSINHMQFVDGGHLKGDLLSDLSIDLAHEAISDAIYTFISLQKEKSLDALNLAADQLRHGSEYLLAPIYQARALDENLCLDAQHLISGIEPDAPARVFVEPVKIDNFFSFIASKAKISDDQKEPKAVIPYYVERLANVTDVSSLQSLAPESIACKMRSRESIFDALDFNYDEGDEQNDLDCARVNQALAERTLALLSPEQRQRLSRKGVSLSYELEEQASGITWLSSFFKFQKVDANSWVIRAQQLKTRLNTKPSAFAGAHYCKLMPASRLIHWALVSALKDD
jgi:hypothetical protein